MLKLENITKSVGEFSLRKIGFTIEKGDYLVLIGRTGAGKSLLLEVITGL
jgi:ABC-type sugar transport system ATPase subunit